MYRRHRRWPTILAVVLVMVLVVGLGVAGWWWWTNRSAPSEATAYRTADVARTDIVSTISASGTVVPEDVIDVGTQ